MYTVCTVCEKCTLYTVLYTAPVGVDGQDVPMEWVDHLFLTLAAKLLKRDIVVIPCFPENGHAGSDFLRFFGGPRQGDQQDTPATAPPILLAVTEEMVFCSGHFQVLATRGVRNIGEILVII